MIALRNDKKLVPGMRHIIRKYRFENFEFDAELERSAYGIYIPVHLALGCWLRRDNPGKDNPGYQGILFQHDCAHVGQQGQPRSSNFSYHDLAFDFDVLRHSHILLSQCDEFVWW